MGGEGEQPVDWRAASRSTVNSFRQNIKVLQQLLRVPRLKSEQSQAHGELLLLPGKWILLRVPRVSCTFSLPSSQSNSKYFISLHQECVCVCMYRFNYIGKTTPPPRNKKRSMFTSGHQSTVTSFGRSPVCVLVLMPVSPFRQTSVHHGQVEWGPRLHISSASLNSKHTATLLKSFFIKKKKKVPCLTLKKVLTSPNGEGRYLKLG